MTLTDVAPVASAFAVACLAVVIYQWVTAMPARLARLVAKDRRAAVTATVKRCETLAAQLTTLSAVNESLRFQLVAARTERKAALVEVALLRRRGSPFAGDDFDAEGETPVDVRDTVRSPPPCPSEDEEETVVVERYSLPNLAPLALPRLLGVPPREPTREEDQTPPEDAP
jgi:hypothetical protein